MKKRLEKVLSSSINLNTYTIVISTNLKNSRHVESHKMWQTFKIHQRRIARLMWNGATIVVVAFDF